MGRQVEILLQPEWTPLWIYKPSRRHNFAIVAPDELNGVVIELVKALGTLLFRK